MATAKKDEAPKVPHTHLALTPSDQVPFAGLLASNPELAAAELTHDEWDNELQRYLASPRP